MKYRGFVGYGMTAMFVVAVLCAGSMPATAQAGKQPALSASSGKSTPPPAAGASAPTPRTADGHPDLSGMWLESFENYKSPGNGPGGAPATAYAADKLPYTPAALKKAHELQDAATSDPLLSCLPYGEPRIWGGPHPARFIQTPGELAILYERDTAYRLFPIDGRPHPKDVDPSYMGNSVGRWDGDTLVVDVIGLIDKSWLGTGHNAGEGTGTFHSDELHVTERMTRPDFDHLNVQITNDDPKVFTHPWTYTWKMKLAPKMDMYEDVTCSNEKDRAHEIPVKSATN